MELTEKQGFKQSEVGLIPEDWDALELNGLGATGRPVIKAGPFGSSLKKEFYVSDGYKIYGQEQVIKNDPFYGDYFINKERYSKLKSCKVLPGDILLSLVGTFGKVLVIPEKALKGIINPRLLRISVDKNKFHTKYISYFLRSTKAIGILESKLQGGTMGVLNASILKSFQFPLPPTLKEQKAIATALSDVDELITGLVLLITKKKAIKQGAMQQLLTPPHKGGKRLPGFTGEWVEKTLGNVADFYKGKGLPKSQISVDGKYECIHYGELFTKYNELIDRVKSRTNFSDNTFVSRANDVLMPTSDVTPNGLATASAIFEDNVILGGDVLVIRPNKNELFGGFLSYQVKLNKPQIMALVSGSTVYHLYGSDMAKFTFAMPRTAEQKAIVVILSDMDTEIEQLESKKAKYQSVKQGMMQELLTGKTRLI